MAILNGDIVQTIHLGMRTSADLMKALANDPAFMNEYSPHHRVGGGAAQAMSGEFQAAEHISFVEGKMHQHGKDNERLRPFGL